MNINKKMVYTSINKTLKKQCDDKPKYLPREVFETSNIMSDQFTYIERYYMSNLFRLTPIIRRKVKSMFTYAVIHNGVFNEKMAKTYNVKISDIQKTYNEYQCYSRYLVGLDKYEAYINYLFQSALIAYKAEKQLYDDFILLTSEEQERHVSPPRMWLEKQMFLAEQSVTIWQTSLKLKREDLVIGMAINYELNEQRKALQNSITEAKLRIIDFTKQLKGKRPAGERKRYFYIERFKLIDVQNGKHTPYIVRMGSISILKSMLQEYCSWFNRLNAEEIRACKSELRKSKQRSAYIQRNKKKLLLKKEKDRLLQQEVLALMIEGLSIRQISDKTGKNYSAIQRTSKQIENLILKQ